MQQSISCPVCQSTFEQQPETCHKCKFPFNASEKEKSKFIGQQILKKGTISDTKEKIKRARIILWVIGGINILFPFLLYANHPQQKTYIIVGLIIGFLFIGFGFFTHKKPFISILIPLILLLFLYTVDYIQEPISLIKGILWKIIFITGLVYGLVSIIQAERIRKESTFLNEKKYQ